MTSPSNSVVLTDATRRGRILMLEGAAAVALLYLVVLGATPAGEWLGPTRAISTVLGGIVVAVYVLAMRHSGDRTDTWVMGALLCFTAATAVSALPRQSLDALVVMLAYACGLSLLRVVLARPRMRRAIVAVIMGLSLLTTVLAVVRLGDSIWGWWRLTGTAPPVGIGFASFPWGHAYDFVLLAVVLWPVWLLGERSRVRTVVAGVVGVAVLIVVVVQGSRAIWLAVALASVLVLAFRATRVLRRSRRRPHPGVVVAAVAGFAVVLLALGGPLLSRLFAGRTIEQRFEMWSAILEAWSQRPVQGFGPGTFPWILQTTSYFDTNSIAPRHPDSAVFQLIGEAGILGLVGAALLIIGVGIPVLRRGPAPAAWALAVFAFAGLTMNPSDFGFLVVVAIFWAGIGTPKGPPARVTRGPRIPSAVFATLLVAVAIPVAFTVVGGLRYDSARANARAGDLRSAIADLDAAISLDPSMALYARQRGTAHLLGGDRSAALTDLGRAVELNPQDDLGWRTLALARRMDGERVSAEEALDRAIDLQRSDPTNLLLRIAWDTEDGAAQRSAQLLEEVVLAWPEIIGAPGWRDVLPQGVSTASVVDGAIARWEAGGPSPEPLSLQPLWLGAIGGRPEPLESPDVRAVLPAELREAFVAVMQCQPEADDLLDAVPEDQRRNGTYWRLIAQWAAATGRTSETADQALPYFRASRPDDDRIEALLNPLRANDQLGYLPDEWGYRRLSIPWESVGPNLPDPTSGALSWTYAPERAARNAGMPRSCVSTASR